MGKVRGIGLRLAIAGGLLTASLGTALATGSAVWASGRPITAKGGVGDAPGGNNGTIKIDDFDIDNRSGSANEPHVECPFTISYFGFDAGTQTSVITFTAQPPSGQFTPVLPLVGPSTVTFQATGPGGDVTHLDHTDTYELNTAGLTEQPQQGFHIKVMVDVTGSQGADSKFKTFWVTPCATPPPSTTTVPPTSSTTVPPTSSTTVSPTSSTTVSPTSSTTAPRTSTTTAPPTTTTGSTTTAPPTPSSSTGTTLPSPTASGTTTSIPSSALVPIGAPGTGGTPPTSSSALFEILGAVLAALGGAVAVLAWWRKRRIAA